MKNQKMSRNYDAILGKLNIDRKEPIAVCDESEIATCQICLKNYHEEAINMVDYDDDVCTHCEPEYLIKSLGHEDKLIQYSEQETIYLHTMENNFEYVLKAGPEYSNLVTIFKINDDKIVTTYAGGEFDVPQTFWFKLDVINKLDLFKDDPVDLSEVSLDNLEGYASEVYNTIMQLDVSEEFKALMGFEI